MAANFKAEKKMDEKIREIGVAQFNPYVRYVNRLEGSVHENHIVALAHSVRFRSDIRH